MFRTAEDTVFVAALVLALGGTFVFAIARMWCHLCRVLQFFDWDVDPARGTQVMWYGVGAAVIGFAVVYVCIRLADPRSEPARRTDSPPPALSPEE